MAQPAAQWDEEVVTFGSFPDQTALAKIYIGNLHKDTNTADLLALVAMVSSAAVERPFLSNVTRGKRWAKLDLDSARAPEFIDAFNFMAGVVHGSAFAEIARG